MFQSFHFVLAKSDLGMWSSVLASVVDGILDAHLRNKSKCEDFLFFA